ncbi:hypothetical protein H4S08_004210 [Coemansia sp. RSA 1365]|nr:hypothetical protein H4S08_004210 [Coemansia sp. RSA 1365]
MRIHEKSMPTPAISSKSPTPKSKVRKNSKKTTQPSIPAWEPSDEALRQRRSNNGVNLSLSLPTTQVSNTGCLRPMTTSTDALSPGLSNDIAALWSTHPTSPQTADTVALMQQMPLTAPNISAALNISIYSNAPMEFPLTAPVQPPVVPTQMVPHPHYQPSSAFGHHPNFMNDMPRALLTPPPNGFCPPLVRSCTDKQQQYGFLLHSTSSATNNCSSVSNTPQVSRNAIPYAMTNANQTSLPQQINTSQFPLLLAPCSPMPLSSFTTAQSSPMTPWGFLDNMH